MGASNGDDEAEPLDAYDTLEAVYERVEGVETLANALAEQLQDAKFVADSPETHAARRRVGQLVFMVADACETTRRYVYEAIERLVVQPAGKRKRRSRRGNKGAG